MNKAKIAKAKAKKEAELKKKNEKFLGNVPKEYKILWAVMIAAYAIWMFFIMWNRVLYAYNEKTSHVVDNIYHNDITGIHSPALYVFWVLASVGCLFLFLIYISKILYAENLTDTIRKICLVSLIFGCIYIVWYGFFDFPDESNQPVDFMAKVKYVTASMIGLEFPWHFRGWGVFASASVFMNTMYAFRKFNYDTKVSKLCVTLCSIGSAAIYVTINCPSWGMEKDWSVARCVGHWAGAVVFAAACAIPIVIFLLAKAKAEKGRFLGAAIAFGIVLLFLGGFTVAGFKSATIENIPMVAAYVLLFVLNFTNFFPERSESADAK